MGQRLLLVKSWVKVSSQLKQTLLYVDNEKQLVAVSLLAAMISILNLRHRSCQAAQTCTLRFE